MKYVYENPELVRAVQAAGTTDEIRTCLKKLADLKEAWKAPAAYGHQLFAPSIDALIPQLAEKLKLRDVPLGKSNERVCIVGTRFWPKGGAGRVTMDIVERFAGQATVIQTVIEGDLRQLNMAAQPELRTGAERSTILLSSGSLLERVIELYMILSAIQPTRIFLMPYWADVVAVLGCWPFRSVVEFLHAADHTPSIGATLPFSGHYDLTYTCHQACREAGVTSGYVGMSAELATTNSTSPRPDGRPIRIGTCGSAVKYRGEAGFRWTDIAVAALSRPDTEIYHMGQLFDQEREIVEALRAAGIDPARYRFLGFVPHMGRELIKQEIDVYLSSYPEAGGKANLEAMAAHLPIILPQHADTAPLLRFSLPLRRWIEVQDPDQIPAAIDAALALKPSLATPEARAEVARELATFADYLDLSS